MEEISGRAAPFHRSVFLQFVSFGDCNGQIMSFLSYQRQRGGSRKVERLQKTGEKDICPRSGKKEEGRDGER